MAKRDVNNYFLEVQNQYLEMLANMQDFKDAYKEGSISQEEYESALHDIELLKSNYERIAYIILLLNKPNRKDKKLSTTELSWYNYLSGASKEAIMDENRDVLADLKVLIKRNKENK